MLKDWEVLFWSKKYIGSNFLPLYQWKDTPLIPTHINGGPWMSKVGHSHTLTARLARCVTSHAPIGAYRARFFPEEPTSCRCGLPMETVQHVLRHCPEFSREDAPKHQLRYKWLVDFLEANDSSFTFDVP